MGFGGLKWFAEKWFNWYISNKKKYNSDKNNKTQRLTESSNKGKIAKQLQV